MPPKMPWQRKRPAPDAPPVAPSAWRGYGAAVVVLVLLLFFYKKLAAPRAKLATPPPTRGARADAFTRRFLRNVAAPPRPPARVQSEARARRPRPTKRKKPAILPGPRTAPPPRGHRARLRDARSLCVGAGAVLNDVGDWGPDAVGIPRRCRRRCRRRRCRRRGARRRASPHDGPPDGAREPRRRRPRFYAPVYAPSTSARRFYAG